MPSNSPSSLSFLLLLFACAPTKRCLGGGFATFSLDFHHRFSDEVRSWLQSTVPWEETGIWVEKATPQYYKTLVAHDHELLHGRGLAADSELTFAGGNETFKLSRLGFLHYSLVNLGTSNLTFLVALDSGSDLFWVPCDCLDCSPTNIEAYNLTFNIFNSKSSSTSTKVTCSSPLCQRKSTCSSQTDACPYSVRYLSANTSSSGTLLEDVLHLATDDARQDAVEARVPFGCGKLQTGMFLRSGAPNGVLGLGFDKVSVPSTLARKGLTSDSFSMCFGTDGLGRITFGDNGTTDQDSTPFHQTIKRPTYEINVTGMSVGNSFLDVNFSAIFDTGTSFTILSDPAYSLITTTFDSLALDKRIKLESGFPFHYCYAIGSDGGAVKRPNMSLEMDGGMEFPLLHPLATFKTEFGRVYCLAILKTRSNINIIGQNFMNGLKVVFNREKHVLGWKQFNCYEKERSVPLPANPPKSTVLPPVTTVSSDSLPPEAAKWNSGSGVLSPVPFDFRVFLFCLPLLTLIIL